MKKEKTYRILIITLLFSLVTGFVCEYLYKTSPQRAINTENFQRKLDEKENEAALTLEKLKQIIIHTSVDSLINYPFENDGITYYVFQNNNMVFWSDNHLDFSHISPTDSTDWHFIQLPNAICVSQSINFESYKLISLITIKHNYSYENNELTNDFATGFKMDKHVQIKVGKETDANAIFCSHHQYLFSLIKPKIPIFNETWSIIGLIAYSLAFLIFFLLYVNVTHFLKEKTLSLKMFTGLTLITGVFTGLCLYFNVPSVIFLNKIFSPFQYASNPLLASISHLSIATAYLISTIYLFYFHVDTKNITNKWKRILMQLIFALYFVLLYYIFSGLIYHSSFQFTILQFNDFSIITVWIHLLILILGIGLALLFFKTHQQIKSPAEIKFAIGVDIFISAVLYLVSFIFYPDSFVLAGSSFTVIWLILFLPYFIPRIKNIYIFIGIWLLFYAAFLVINATVINNNKMFDKYKVLAQNISINGNTENDRMADILLEELDVQISNDKKIAKLITNIDSVSLANSYLNVTYLRGFWNKYDMRLNVAQPHSELYNEYSQYISGVGNRIKHTHFYSVPSNENNMSYIGAFTAKTSKSDSLIFYMEFYPRRNFKSYSFPNLLIAATPDIQTQLNISIAKYENQKLVYSSGKIEYSNNPEWIQKHSSNFFRQIYNNRIHYIYAPNNYSFIVITEQQLYDPVAYLLYFLYVFLTYFSICWLIVWGYLFISKGKNFRIGLTAKFQYAFISLLIISFLGIFYVSVNFIEKKYQEEQIANLESKKNYVQKALQDMYYWNQDLNILNSQNLNFDLQDLSYIYHTDIHVYDNHGILVGSSQPLIFNKSLISNRIAPAPFFTLNSNLNQYEHIGKLNYLTGYTDFVNGDYVQIGYIAIPQFFSQDEIRNEIERFLAVIIHIYLIIIVLAVLLSLFIGKQLSAPLIMIENKLKEMRLGQRNEKIDYSLNDEIGQLVIQYNRTVDELEHSAELLAKSERESAWKSMARQVAHEINNPLTPMKLTIQQLQRTKNSNDERFDDYFIKSTAMLIEQIDNLSRIAGTFSNFARMPEANFVQVDIAARLRSVVRLFANNFDHVKIGYKGKESEIYVFADPEQLVQVFNNLLKNAMQAIPDNKKGEINVEIRENVETVVLEITDNGTGIDEETRDKLFVPNFTTKSTGMGLGLAISKNIIELSGGSISFVSKPGEGTTFIINLPKGN